MYVYLDTKIVAKDYYTINHGTVHTYICVCKAFLNVNVDPRKLAKNFATVVVCT